MNTYAKLLISVLVFESCTFSQTFTIQASCGDHGIIVPSGKNEVSKGDSLLFRFIPDVGYMFTNVTIDGVENPFAWSTYEFRNVDQNHTITVKFEKSMRCGFTPLEGRHLWKKGTEVPPNTISPDQFEYRGAFRLPAGGDIPSTWSYGGLDFAYNPDGNKNSADDGYPGSLFGVGHVYGPMCSEITIPKPIISKNIKDLNRAEVIQPFQTIYDGNFENSGEIHGIEYLPKQGQQNSDILYFGLGPTHLPSGNHRYANHGWCNSNLSSSEKYGLWYVGGVELSSAWTGYYLFDIPADITKLLGEKSIATGRYRAGQGCGPHLFAIAPWEDGNPPKDGTELNYKELLNYSEDDNMAVNDYRYNDFYSGIAWATSGDRSTVLFSAIMGYKCIWFDHGMYSDSTVTGIKFYNPQDLIDVAKGDKKPYAPQPYATLNITDYLYSNIYHTVKSPMANGNEGELYESGTVLGGAFDRKNSLLYATEAYADESAPIIHVWKIQEFPSTVKTSSKKPEHSCTIFKKNKKQVTINLTLNTEISNTLNLEIVDLKGKILYKSLIKTISSPSFNISIDTEKWATGVYICKLTGRNPVASAIFTVGLGK